MCLNKYPYHCNGISSKFRRKGKLQFLCEIKIIVREFFENIYSMYVVLI